MKINARTTMTLALATLLVSAGTAVAAADLHMDKDDGRQAPVLRTEKAGTGEEIEFSDPTNGYRTAACLTRTADGTCVDSPPPSPSPSGGNRICDFMNAVFGDAVNIQFLCP